MRRVRTLDLTAPGIVLGNHGVWLPEMGIKVPFQWGGRAVKRTRPDENETPIGDTLPHEVAILRALAALGMAPPIGDLVYFEEVISDHLGWHSDPVGAWGFEMADARRLPPGGFDARRMRQLPIAGSQGAWGDISAAGRDNVVNGYLVDVRRSAFDMLRWCGDGLFALPELREPAAAIAADVHRLCQYPRGEREVAYQDFYLDGKWQVGQRRIHERAAVLEFLPRAGETVLEIGCQAGGFLQFSHVETGGKGTFLGVELEPDYIACGKRLARRARQNICFRQMDAIGEADALVQWIERRCPRGLDHLLLLSMEKHLGHGPMFALVDRLRARRTYVETNAVSDRNPWKLREQIEERGGRYVGDSTDRNLRRLYRIDRN